MHPPSNTGLQAPSGSLLRPGRPAAHESVRLGLLPPGPDPVHRFSLRRTRPSTLLTGLRPYKHAPRVGIQSRYSGLRVQGTATSPPSTVRLSIPALHVVPVQSGLGPPCHQDPEAAAAASSSKGARSLITASSTAAASWECVEGSAMSVLVASAVSIISRTGG